MRFALFALMAAMLIAARPAAGADVPTARVSDVTDLASLLEGEFTTAPDPAAGQTSREGPAPLYDLAKRVDVPALGHDVVYAELREGSPDGHLLRQRLYSLIQDPNGSRIMMTAYDLGSMPELAGAYANPVPLAKLNPPDLKPQSKECAIAWHRTDNGFVGESAGGTCARANIAVSKEGMTQASETSGAPASVFRRLR